MPIPERRSIFNDMNLPEWRADMVRRDSSDYAMPGTAATPDPEATQVQTGYHAIKMRMSGNQSVTTAAGNERVPWDSVVYTTDPFIHFPGSPSRYFVPEGLGGFWRYTVRITTDTWATHNNRMDIHLRKNSAGDETFATGTSLQTWRLVGHVITGDMSNGPFMDVCLLNVGDHIELFAEALDENVSIQGGGSGASYMIFEYCGPQQNADVE